MHATHVVVDTRDGYTFWNDSTGQLFDQARATSFAGQRNAERKPEHRTYQVFALTTDLDAATMHDDNLSHVRSPREQAELYQRSMDRAGYTSEG